MTPFLYTWIYLVSFATVLLKRRGRDGPCKFWQKLSIGERWANLKLGPHFACSMVFLQNVSLFVPVRPLHDSTRKCQQIFGLPVDAMMMSCTKLWVQTRTTIFSMRWTYFSTLRPCADCKWCIPVFLVHIPPVLQKRSRNRGFGTTTTTTVIQWCFAQSWRNSPRPLERLLDLSVVWWTSAFCREIEQQLLY